MSDNTEREKNHPVQSTCNTNTHLTGTPVPSEPVHDFRAVRYDHSNTPYQPGYFNSDKPLETSFDEDAGSNSVVTGTSNVHQNEKQEYINQGIVPRLQNTSDNMDKEKNHPMHSTSKQRTVPTGTHVSSEFVDCHSEAVEHYPGSSHDSPVPRRTCFTKESETGVFSSPLNTEDKRLHSNNLAFENKKELVKDLLNVEGKGQIVEANREGSCSKDTGHQGQGAVQIRKLLETRFDEDAGSNSEVTGTSNVHQNEKQDYNQGSAAGSKFDSENYQLNRAQDLMKEIESVDKGKLTDWKTLMEKVDGCLSILQPHAHTKKRQETETILLKCKSLLTLKYEITQKIENVAAVAEMLKEREISYLDDICYLPEIKTCIKDVDEATCKVKEIDTKGIEMYSTLMLLPQVLESLENTRQLLVHKEIVIETNQKLNEFCNNAKSCHEKVAKFDGDLPSLKCLMKELEKLQAVGKSIHIPNAMECKKEKDEELNNAKWLLENSFEQLKRIQKSVEEKAELKNLKDNAQSIIRTAQEFWGTKSEYDALVKNLRSCLQKTIELNTLDNKSLELEVQNLQKDLYACQESLQQQESCYLAKEQLNQILELARSYQNVSGITDLQVLKTTKGDVEKLMEELRKYERYTHPKLLQEVEEINKLLRQIRTELEKTELQLEMQEDNMEDGDTESLHEAIDYTSLKEPGPMKQISEVILNLLGIFRQVSEHAGKCNSYKIECFRVQLAAIEAVICNEIKYRTSKEENMKMRAWDLCRKIEEKLEKSNISDSYNDMHEIKIIALEVMDIYTQIDVTEGKVTIGTAKYLQQQLINYQSKLDTYELRDGAMREARKDVLHFCNQAHNALKPFLSK